MERTNGLLGKIQEFIDPTPIEDKYTQLLNRAYTEIFQPMGFKRAGQNFRLFTPDGLGKIVNFRKDKWNQKGRRLGFLIYTGVYFEPEPVIKDRKFKGKKQAHIQKNPPTNPAPIKESRVDI